MTTTEATPAAQREIVLDRVFDAPRERVFQAWTEPDALAHWWGPEGFRTTTHEMEVRPGGTWRFTLHGPDGTDYPNRIVFRDVARPERLAYAHDDDGAGRHPGFDVTVTFDEDGGRTRLVMRMDYRTAEAREHAVQWGVQEGGRETLARLAAYLAAP